MCGEDSETVSASGRPLASGDMPPAAQRVSGNTAAPPAAMQPTHVPCEETADCNLQIQAAVQSVYGSAESRFAKQPHTASQTPDSCAGSVRASTQVPYTEHVPSTPLLPQDTLPQNRARVVSASDKFGRLAMAEARKGLSRVLQTGCIEDLESFALQLQTADKAACAADYEECDDIPVFALTYRHADAAEGCGFAFGDGLHCSQWVNFVVCMKEIAFCGIGKIRVWVDQCMWIREGGYVGRGGWAHTGVVPYVLWPVISLGYKRPGAERSVVTERRMWPFLEEVAGLWSMGVMITEEMRDMTDERSLRRTCSFNRRTQLEPERAMEVLLLNVFHGACDELEMGCKSDLEELEQMAVLNVFADSEDIFVGSDWRERAAGIRKKAYGIAIFSIRLSLRSETLGGYDVYIDASRKAQGKTWNGLVEFLSGHSSGLEATENDWGLLRFGMGKYNIVADNMELLLLELGIHTQRKSAGLWLIVCMEGQSSNFSRGTVRWTKVAMGKSGCNMGRALKKGNYLVLGKCLEEQIGERVRIKRVTNTDMLPVPHVVTTDSSLQSATPAESLHASAESSFPEVPHTPSLHPNQIAVPVPPPTALPHMAYVPSRKLLPPDTVPQAYARIASATFELGALAVSEARKGLSRVLQTGNDKDLELFAGQLQTADKAACESDYGKKDKVPVFALSYQQFDPPPGSRFKFGDGLQCRQWANFVVCMKEIANVGQTESQGKDEAP